MAAGYPTQIAQVLLQLRLTRRVLDRHRTATALLAALRRRLPRVLRPHCLDAQRHGDQLKVVLDSPAWATRLRFLAYELDSWMAERGLNGLAIQVRPATGPSAEQPSRNAIRHRLSAKTAQHLLEAAEHIEDPTLQDALRRLGQRHLPPA